MPKVVSQKKNVMQHPVMELVRTEETVEMDLRPERRPDIMIDPFIEKCIRHAMRSQHTVAFKGVPGVGKSAGVSAFCKKWGYSVDVILMSQRNQEDILGYPVRMKRTITLNGEKYPVIRYAPTGVAVRAATAQRHCLFIDEVTDCTPQQSVFANQIILERAIGELQLDPSRVFVVAAFNPPEVSTTGAELRPTTVNRMSIQNITPNREFFIKGFPSYWGNAPTLGFNDDGLQLDPATWTWARAIVASFLHRNSSDEKFCCIPKEEARRSEPFVTPRSLDHASRELASVRQDGGSPEDALPYMRGWIGELAIEVATFAMLQDQRDPEEVINEEIAAFNGDARESDWKRSNPSPFQLPASGDTVFALLCAMCESVCSKLTPARGVALWRILHAAANQGAKDTAVSANERFFRLWNEKRNGMPKIIKEVEPYMSFLEKLGKFAVKKGPIT